MAAYNAWCDRAASIIARITVDPKSPNQDSAEQLTKSAKVLMNIPQPYYNHYGGMITFGPDGKLYIGKGDAGWEGDPLNAGQSLNVLWGKLLRIDVDTDKVEQIAMRRSCSPGSWACAFGSMRFRW